MNKAEKSQSLMKGVAVGAAWLVGAQWSIRLISLVSTAILARLLAPEDFGLAAIVLSTIMIMEGLTAVALGSVLIYEKTPTRDDYDTAWTISVIRGLMLGGIVLLATYPIVAFVGDDRLFWPLVVIALKPVLMGANNPRFVDFEKNLRFHIPVICMLSTRTASVSVTIYLALTMKSYWALVIGDLVAVVTMLILSYVMRPHPPRFTLSKFKKFFDFSLWITLSVALGTLNTNLDAIFTGGLINVRAAGLMSMSKQITEIATFELSNALARALFPGLATIRDRREYLKTKVVEGLGYSAILFLPIGMGLASVAAPAVRLALGEQWGDTVSIIQVWAPIFALQCVFNIARPLALALGETKAIFIVILKQTLFRMPLFIGAVLLFGLPGAVAAVAIDRLYFVALRVELMEKTAEIRFGHYIKEVAGPLFASVVMAVIVQGARRFAWPDASAILDLSGSVCVGAASYVGLIFLIWRLRGMPSGPESMALDFVRSRLRSKEPRQSDA